MLADQLIPNFYPSVRNSRRQLSGIDPTFLYKIDYQVRRQARHVGRIGFALALVLVEVLASTRPASAASGPGICSNDKTVACSVDADCGAGNTCFIPTAGGQTLDSQVCMQTAAGQHLNCTANDIDIAQVTDLSA